MPGVRTFRSARFRLVIGIVLCAAGWLVLGTVLLRQASNPAGQWGFDFAAYHTAAAELLAGRSPYAAEMFGGPIPAQGAILYKYPPLLAQLFAPLAGLPLALAAVVWFAGQALMILLGVWLAARAGGAPRSAETLVWSGVAATFFLPCFDTLWKGNVSGALLLFVGLGLAGGAAGAAGATAATLLKTTPAVLLVPAFARGRTTVRGLLAGLAVGGISLLLAPAAWWDFARVLPNLVSGPSLYATNLAPHSLVSFAAPDLPLVAEAARVAAIGLALGALGASVLLARRTGRWAAALTLAVAASLLLPSATWYHYLAVLLPIAAYAWPRARTRARLALLAGAGAISLGVAWLPLAVGGSALVVVTALAIVSTPGDRS